MCTHTHMHTHAPSDSLPLQLRPLGSRALFYLAAAVSDFYLPLDLLPEHKIQSSSSSSGADGALQLRLLPVPKKLKELTSRWAPEAFFASFKLETDQTILLSKARAAIDKYGTHLVVANLLQTRREAATLVWATDGGATATVELRREASSEGLEAQIVAAVKARHSHFRGADPQQER